MPATATFLGSLSWAYPTAPGTYDLTTVIPVGMTCPVGSVILVGTAYVVFNLGSLNPAGTPPVTDDGGVNYSQVGAFNLNTVGTQRGAISALLLYTGLRFNVLSAGQQITLRRSTVTITSAPSYAHGYVIDFAYLWQGATAVGVIGAGAEVAPGGVVAASSGAHLVPVTGTYDLLGMGVAALWQNGGSPGIGPPVGAIGSLTWAEDAPFSREHTFLQDNPWEDPGASSRLNGPGLYLSKATVTRAGPTSEVYTATLTDPASPAEGDQWLAAFAYPTGLTPDRGQGVANLHDRWGRYHVAEGAPAGLRYRRSHSDRPPFMLDVAPTSTTGDARPSIAQDWLGYLWLLFERGTDTYETRSTDHGKTWSTPTLVFTGGTHPCNKTDPENGLRLRAAYKTHTIIADVRYPGDLAPSAQFTFKDAAGAALGVEDDDFDLSLVGPASPRRYQLAARKTGATEVSFWYSTDFGRTWTEETA